MMIASLVARILWGYQRFISPLSPSRCRYFPSCSQYAREAVLKYGALHGVRLAVSRLVRCHPWAPGGVDLVP